MLTPTNTFDSRFKRLTELNEAGNANISNFAAANDASKTSKEAKLSILTKDKESVILAADGNKGVLLIHSIVNLGGTLMRPENKIVCLQGLGSDPQAFLLDADSISKALLVDVLVSDRIVACTQQYQFDSLRATRGGEKLNCFPVFIPAPFEANAILNAETRSPFELMKAVKEAALSQDADDSVYESWSIEDTVKFSTHVKDNLACWLWAVGAGEIPKIDFNIDTDDAELKAFKATRVKECILPSVTASGTVADSAISSQTMAQLNITLAQMTESNNRTNAIRSLKIERARAKDEASKDRIKDWLDDSQKKMILNVMSIDGIQPADELTEDFKKFMNSKTIGQAGKEILNQQSAAGFPNTTVAEGAITSIYHGNLISLEPTVVSGLSPFAFSKTLPLAPTQRSSFMIMHMHKTLQARF